MKYIDVFLSLGGNIGESYKILTSTINEIAENSNIRLIKTSHFYKTSPVSSIKQSDFINCACHIQTLLSPLKLLKVLQEMELKMGKAPKSKESPRIIDIDIIFFGDQTVASNEINIPHCQWQNRLFVLTPLSDILSSISITDEKNHRHTYNISDLLKKFINTNNERVTIIN